MAIEIERKFLVTSTRYRSLAEPDEIRQGYFKTDGSVTIRVRTRNRRGSLTIKGQTTGITRAEYEYEIPYREAEQLLDRFCSGLLLEKKRYTVHAAGNIWEIDEFTGSNDGLVVAEIELHSEDQAFEKPAWIGEEVSGKEQYYNYLLTRDPFQNWPKTQRDAVLSGSDGRCGCTFPEKREKSC